MQRRKTRGFTLLEIVIVLAIVAIGVGIAVYTSTRNREMITIDRALSNLRVRIEKAQSLAAVAGSRLGTARVQVGALCLPGPLPNPYLWVQIQTNGQVTLPAEIVPGPNGTVTVNCEVFDLAAITNGVATLEFPTALTLFGFTSEGRVVLPGAPTGTGSVFVGFRETNGARRFGFRVLPSGVFCQANQPNAVVCDEEA